MGLPEMRSPWIQVGPTPYDLCSDKKGKFGHRELRTEEYDVKRHGEKTAIYKPRILLSTSTVSHSVVCPTLCDPHGLQPRQAPLSMGFSRQEYWSG